MKNIKKLRVSCLMASLTLGTVILCGLPVHATQNQQAPTPGHRFFIDRAELPAVTDRATSGDISSIQKLIDYYMLYIGDESKGVFWLERLGDTGDAEARKAVLTYLAKHPSVEGTKHLAVLRSRWAMSKSGPN
jgi:hypothetical protein